MGEEIPEPGQAARQAALAAGWSHRHRDVSGGWLRPTVFGAVDGLVTNSSLIAGLGGGGVSAHAIVLTGVAALVAGAFSMGTGEYVSVTNQNELVHAEVATERRMHARFPDAEQAELAETFRGYGADPETAARMAAAVSRDPDTALRVHTREELGVDPFELPSAIAAGLLSLIAFSAGALIPLLPYLAGLSVLAVALGIAAVALLAGGVVVGRLTGRPLAPLRPAPAFPGRGRRRGDVRRGQPHRRPRRLTGRRPPPPPSERNSAAVRTHNGVHHDEERDLTCEEYGVPPDWPWSCWPWRPARVPVPARARAARRPRAAPRPRPPGLAAPPPRPATWCYPGRSTGRRY